jgi:hypothetical protein
MVLTRQGANVGCACNDWTLKDGEVVCRDCGSTLSHPRERAKVVCMIQPNCERPANRWVYDSKVVFGPMCNLHAQAYVWAHGDQWRVTSDPDDLGGPR